MTKAGTSHIRHVLLAQLVVVLVVPLCLLVWGKLHFLSALAGGLISIIGNAYFAWKIFAKQRENTPGRELGTFFSAEIGKAAIMISLMISAYIIIRPLSIMAFIGTFLICYVTPMLASFYFNDDMDWRTKNVR